MFIILRDKVKIFKIFYKIEQESGRTRMIKYDYTKMSEKKENSQ